MKTEIKFLEGNEFTHSLRNFYQKGGIFKKAAKIVQAAWGRAHAAYNFNKVF